MNKRKKSNQTDLFAYTHVRTRKPIPVVSVFIAVHLTPRRSICVGRQSPAAREIRDRRLRRTISPSR